MVLLPICSCTPLVLHGPRVQQGWRFPISGAVGIVPETVSDSPEALPFFTAGFTYGWLGPTAAFSLGAQVPVFPHPAVLYYGAAIDAYVQPVRSADGGFGFLTSPSFTMPYAQYGGALGAGAQWFTTQGAAFTHGDFGPGTYWMPTLAVRRGGREGGSALTLHGGAGVPVEGSAWFAVVGLVFEIARSSTR